MDKNIFTQTTAVWSLFIHCSAKYKQFGHIMLKYVQMQEIEVSIHSSSSSILNTIEYKNTVLFKIAPLSGISIYSNNMSQVHSESLQYIQKVFYA